MTNRGFALNALSWYQRASLIPSLSSLEGVLDSKYPGFLDLWGQAARGIPQSVLRPALEKLARKNGMSYPTRAELNQILLDSGAALVSVSGAVKSGSLEAVKEIGEVSGGILKFGLPVLALGGVLFFAWKSGVFSAGKK